MHSFTPTFLFLFFLSGLRTLSPAQSITLLPGENEGETTSEFNWLPYAFFSESFGLGVGVGGAVSRWPSPETTLLGAATVGTTGSYNMALALNKQRVPGFKRLYMSPFVIGGYYRDQILYIGNNNPGFESERAGSNDSSPDNNLLADQWDNQAQIEFSYLLPIGDGSREEDIINTYRVQFGILQDGATGGKALNPFKSGRTSVLLTPKWREQTLKQDDKQVPLETLNVEVALEWDNRDFPSNPGSGNYYQVSYTKDFRDEDALSGWEVLSGDFEWVANLGPSESSKQRVLVFNFSTDYVLNWEEDADGNTTRRPPQYEGATLGGLYRMRGFETDRFHDRAASYYSVEFRSIPEWQPLRKVGWLSFAKIQYWQWILFAEAGRVSEEYNSELFYEDLHVDGGISLRGMLHTAVLRLDVAISEEGSRVVAMYGHPF